MWHLICFWQIMYMRRKGQNTSGSCVRPVFRKIRSLPGVMLTAEHKGHYILMHSVIYRTKLLRECGLELPKHTFYVDNIYVYKPLPHVRTILYGCGFLPLFYRKRDQSVNEVMISRIDQQIRVNKIMIDDVDLNKVSNYKCRHYMINYLEIITVVTTVMLLRSGTEENLEKRELWRYIKNKKDIGLFPPPAQQHYGTDHESAGKKRKKNFSCGIPSV